MLSFVSLSQTHGEGVLFGLPDMTFAIQAGLTTGNSSLLQPWAPLVLYTPSLGMGSSFPGYPIQ